MSIDSAIYTRMSGFAGLSALVSTRIYPAGDVPQNATYPLCTYSQISGVRGYVMGGQSEFVDARFQVDSWGETSISVRAVAEQVRLGLSTYHGTSDSVVIDYIVMDNEICDYDSDAELHRIIHDYRIVYRETAP